jgi:Flp pilus assembly protein TadB
MRPEDDALRNASLGCLWPVARNFLLTGLAFLIAATLGIIAHNFWVFIGVMIGLTLIHGSIWRRYWKPREDAASTRFWGTG